MKHRGRECSPSPTCCTAASRKIDLTAAAACARIPIVANQRSLAMIRELAEMAISWWVLSTAMIAFVQALEWVMS